MHIRETGLRVRIVMLDFRVTKWYRCAGSLETVKGYVYVWERGAVV